MAAATGNEDWTLIEERALVPFYGRANPVWRWGLPDPVDPESADWLGSREQLLAMLPDAEAPRNMRLPDHVFPVVSEFSTGGRLGLVVPVAAEPAERWHVSDAFGRFDRDQATVHGAFERLLLVLESAWRHAGLGVLPLRWRRPFAFRLLAPVHLECIAGISLQWPLALALLRAAAGGGESSRLPFGPGPVFATGQILNSGVIGEVLNVRAKLCGFWREFGRDRPVFLTDAQRRSLDDLDFSGVPVLRVNALHGLFHLPEFATARNALLAAPGAGELDALMLAMEQDDAGVRFQQVADMAEWLLPAAEHRPSYAYRLHFKRGQVRLHRGQPEASVADWAALDTLIGRHPACFGADERLALASAEATCALDRGMPRDGLERLGAPELAACLPHASLGQRAQYHGVCCELARATGRHDQAIAAGDRAIRIAEAGHTSYLGRLTNFTVHALLARARAHPGHAGADLALASGLLERSRGALAPCHNARARQAHLGFCLHLEAELHRAHGVPFVPPPQWRSVGEWDHPALFTLLSVVRNGQNPPEVRQGSASDLHARAAEMRERHSGTVFTLLAGVYDVVHAATFSHPVSAALDRLEAALVAGDGMPGWACLLRPALDALRLAEEPADEWAAVERLCDAVPYH